MKFYSKPVIEHEEVPLADAGRWEELVSHWRAREARGQQVVVDAQNDCYVVSVIRHSDELHSTRMAEIVSLVASQGDRIVGKESRRIEKAEPRTLFRRGLAESIAARARACGAKLLVLDAELTPSQTRNLEDATGMAVCDREAVILNVFRRHARTRAARIQAEIAHLQYLRPRIRGLGLDMDQQAGGVMRGRGPGETASELMARHLDQRMTQLRRAARRLRNTRWMQRGGRLESRRIVLVGYTNAGKTSLMNALTRAELSVADRLFETLDSTTRCLCRHGRDVLLSDTVGFIRRLPPKLLASFESTFAEVVEASLIVVVADLSDPELALHLETTETLLRKFGVAGRPRWYVFNKVDRVGGQWGAETLRRLSGGCPFTVLSAFDTNSVGSLRRALLFAVRGDHRRKRIFVPYAAAEVMKQVYATCRVLATQSTARGLRMTIEGHAAAIARLERRSQECRR